MAIQCTRRSEYTEQETTRQILNYLERRQVFAWRNNTGRRGRVSYGLKGSADIIGILPGGRFLAIEVKVPGKKPSEEQMVFLQRVAEKGGLAIIAYSVDDVITSL
ncbi:MAG: VRR-NUC domain-containing protein [Armatimonadota bacterium]|nr:VRR-NUC domain-containing protein [Armatimonadota bacterium]